MDTKITKSSSIAEAVGSYVIAFSLLELMVDNTIRDLVWFSKSEQQGRVILIDEAGKVDSDEEQLREEVGSRYRISNALIGELDYSRKVRMLFALSTARVPGKNIELLERLSKQLLAHGTERNEMLHSAWVGGDIKSTRYRIQRSNVTREARPELTEESPQTIDKKTESVIELTDELIAWLSAATEVTNLEITKKSPKDSE